MGFPLRLPIICPKCGNEATAKIYFESGNPEPKIPPRKCDECKTAMVLDERRLK